MSQQPSSNYAPAPEGGTKFLILLVSFFIPVAGIVIGIIYEPSSTSMIPALMIV